MPSIIPRLLHHFRIFQTLVNFTAPLCQCVTNMLSSIKEPVTSTVKSRVDIARDWAVEFAREWVKPVHSSWAPLAAGRMTSYAQITGGLAAIMHSRFGELWPLEVRLAVLPVPESGPLKASADLISMLPPPRFGICLLQTSSHWMQVVATPGGNLQSFYHFKVTRVQHQAGASDLSISFHMHSNYFR